MGDEETVHFPNLTWENVKDNEGSGVTEMESLCMACHENGSTKLFLTRIPHFKEVILMSFACPHCNFRNTEVQSAGEIQVKGSKYTVSVKTPESASRQVIKSEHASIMIPEIDLEIPSITQRGVCSTIEGILMTAADNLEAGQEERRKIDPATTAQIDAVIEKMRQLHKCEMPYTFVLDDPSGNSFVENPKMPQADPDLKEEHYVRNAAQNASVGIQEAEQVAEEPINLTEEVVELPVNCSTCNAAGVNRMKVTNIPNFKEIVLMSFNCEQCGYKSIEIKPGGKMEPKGKKISLKLTMEEDLSRDFLKSDTAAVLIPAFELELAPGTLGGMFTTIEGFLNQTIDHMKEFNPFAAGDSATSDQRSKFGALIEKLEKLKGGDLTLAEELVLIIDDPMSNSYIQNLYAPDPDPNMTTEVYERTAEQNEELGLNDMRTEGSYDKSATEIFKSEQDA